MMKYLKISALMVIAFFLCGCPCLFNNQGTLNVKNNSKTNTIYDVNLDGINIGTVNPGQLRAFNDAPAGDSILIFYIHGTNVMACSPVIVNIPRCGSSNVISCDY